MHGEQGEGQEMQGKGGWAATPGRSSGEQSPPQQAAMLMGLNREATRLGSLWEFPTSQMPFLGGRQHSRGEAAVRKGQLTWGHSTFSPHPQGPLGMLCGSCFLCCRYWAKCHRVQAQREAQPLSQQRSPAENSDPQAPTSGKKPPFLHWVLTLELSMVLFL